MIQEVRVLGYREAKTSIDRVALVMPDSVVLVAQDLQCESGEDGDGSGGGVVLLNDPCRMQGSLQFAPPGSVVCCSGLFGERGV